MFKHLIFFLITFFILSCHPAADSPYEPISFVKKSSMSEIGRSSAVAFVINDKGYVALGRSAIRSSAQYPLSALSDCWRYDPKLDNWEKMKSSFPGTPRVNATAQVVNGKAYIGLGYDISKGAYSGGNLFDLWMYDPNDDTWTKKANLQGLTAATNKCVSFVYNDNIYIGAGYNGEGFSNEFWKYNPSQDTWTRLNDFPSYQRSGAVLCATSEHVYFGTGYRSLSENDWWEYFPANDTWKQLKDMPDTGRENAIALSISNTIGNRYFVSTGLYFGGTLTSGHVKSDILEYDPLLNVWYKRGNIPNGERENAIAFTINGKGYIGFGENQTSILNDFWCFEP